ncbi:glycosyl transferase family protein [Salinisphaera sp. T5B8]|uniref:glycosyltransferase family 9 protein n=1 Tax=Salinisphaera sp. T5B8 TaxID=1304154 RepID=UPI003341DBCD
MARSKQVNATGFKAWIKRLRRGNRQRFNRLLTRLFGTAEPRRRALAADTRRILVVRLNKRLGNILFLTPMLRSLAASLPAATIDVVIQDPRQKPLLEGLPGIGQVWVQEKSIRASLRLLRRLRAIRYDLAIDPSGNSTSNRLALAFARAKQRMGFAARDQWLALTHAAPRPVSRHQAIQGVELLTTSVDDFHWTTFESLAVFPGEASHAAAQRHWQAAFTAPVRANTPIVGFFTRATGRKQLDHAWWQAFVELFQQRLPNARLLQVRAPDQPEPIAADIASVAIAELDVLAALLSRLDGFVAADSGPMHLAAAAGVPVVGLFKATAPASYAPLGPGCTALEASELAAERVLAAVAERACNTETRVA